MKTYQIRVNNIRPHSNIHNEQQCFHDIVLDDLVEIGPVTKSNIGNSAGLLLVYSRPHNTRSTIHFESYTDASNAREQLVQAWREHALESVTSKDRYVTIRMGDGDGQERPVCLTGIRNITPIDNELHVSYADGGAMVYWFVDNAMALGALDTINTALVSAFEDSNGALQTLKKIMNT